MIIKIPISFYKNLIRKNYEKGLKGKKTFGNFSVKKDLAYIDDGNKFHLLDILSPVLGSENGVVLFYIHGGSYLYGVKEASRIFCSWFTNQGFTVIAMNYRLIDVKENVDFRSQMQDVFAALNYIANNKNALGLKLDKFCVMGDSAGGHMALMTDIIFHSKDAQKYYGIEKLPNVDIKCVALNSTMYDYENLCKESRRTFTKAGTAAIFSKNWKDPEYLKLNSPRYYVEECGVKFKPLFNSTSLHDFFREESIRFKLSCEKHGVDCWHYFEPSVNKKIGHVYNHFEFENEGKKCNEAMVKFFKAHCNIE